MYILNVHSECTHLFIYIYIQAVICSCYSCEPYNSSVLENTSYKKFNSQSKHYRSSLFLLYKVCMCFRIILCVCMYTDSLTTFAVGLNAGSPRFIKWELENFEASKR